MGLPRVYEPPPPLPYAALVGGEPVAEGDSLEDLLDVVAHDVFEPGAGRDCVVWLAGREAVAVFKADRRFIWLM